MTQLDDDYAVYAARTYGTPMPAKRRAQRAGLRIGQKIMLFGLTLLLLGVALSTFAHIYGR